MAAIDMRADLSLLIDSVSSGRIEAIVAAARSYLEQDKAADVLLARIGMQLAHRDTDGHPLITLTAASMLGRLIHWIPAPVNAQELPKERALPLFVQGLKVAATVMSGLPTSSVPQAEPAPFFPSELMDSGKTMNEVMHDAVQNNDALLAERALLGLYGTGADYRTMQVRAYEAVSTTFQRAGHPFTYAVRGFQLLDAVEWGNRVPNIIHWLAPHLPLQPNEEEPGWIATVRGYISDPKHDLKGVRTRISAPKNQSALPLHALLLSEADTSQVCQGVYDAIIQGEASPRAVASVISLAAADVLQRTGNEDRELFIRVGHGLLFASAIHQAFQQVQDVEILNLLFTSAAYINALHKELAIPTAPGKADASRGLGAGGGLIAASQLETLSNHLHGQDFPAALALSRRYLELRHDPRALFGTIGLAAAYVDARADAGHTLQIVQAASEEYLTWLTALQSTSIDSFLQVALRAALFGPRDGDIANL